MNRFFVATLTVFTACFLTAFDVLAQSSSSCLETTQQTVSVAEKIEELPRWVATGIEYLATPVPGVLPTPVTGRFSVQGPTKTLTYVGDSGAQRMRYSAEVSPSLPLDFDTNYYIEFDHRVDNVHCYNFAQYSNYGIRAIVGNLADTKGIWCGNPKFSAIFRERRGTGPWTAVRTLQLNTPTRLDGTYTSHEARPWTKERVLIKTPSRRSKNPPDQFRIDFRLEMDGFNGNFYLDNLALVKPSDTFDDQMDGGEISESVSFRGMKIANYSPLCSTLSNSNPLTVSTANTQFIFRTGGAYDSVEFNSKATRSGETRFRAGFLQQLRLRKAPIRPGLPGIVELSNQNISFRVGSDSTLVAKFKSLSAVEQVDFLGDPMNSSAGRAADFYSNQEMGTFFEVDLLRGRGIFFSPVYPQQMVAKIPRAGYATAGQAGPSLSDDRGDWRYNEDYLRDTLYRNNWKVISGPQNWLQGRSTASHSRMFIRYTFDSHDIFLASLLPAVDTSGSLMCNERFQNSLAVDPKKQESASNNISRHLQRISTSPVNLDTVFLNWTKYSRAINTQIPSYYYVEKTSATSETDWLAPDDSLPLCTNVTTYPAKCRALLEPGADIQGPWMLSSLNNEGQNVEQYLNRLKGAGTKSALYVGLQFYYTRSIDSLLNNLGEMIGSAGNSGYYFDGAITGDPLRTLEVLRGARALVGENGAIIFHLSKDNMFLPQSDHYFFPGPLAHASVRVLGEGVKKDWDHPRTNSMTSCPKVWGLMYSGLFSAPAALLPEIRPFNYSQDDTSNVQSSIHPIAQTEAQLTCGGMLFAPTTESASIGFSDKSRTLARMCLPTNLPYTSTNSFYSCPNNGEVGYWPRLQSRCSP